MNLALVRCARTAAAAVASIGKIKSSAGDIVIADGSTGPVTATKQRGAMASEMAAEHAGMRAAVSLQTRL